MPERLLDDDPAPTPGITLESRALEARGDHAENRRRCRHIEKDVSLRLVFTVELSHEAGEPLKGGRVVELPGRVVQTPHEVVPYLRVELFPRRELLDVLAHPAAELLRV